ncbi:uncharacterized protein V1518DRAFT_407613 [Limtongia smithiae]|uniref:uncharacterized protein n=1 Tax=Limtongia smithiae TaxID=1125753 RepID=UPI0034CD373C
MTSFETISSIVAACVCVYVAYAIFTSPARHEDMARNGYANGAITVQRKAGKKKKAKSTRKATTTTSATATATATTSTPATTATATTTVDAESTRAMDTRQLPSIIATTPSPPPIFPPPSSVSAPHQPLRVLKVSTARLPDAAPAGFIPVRAASTRTSSRPSSTYMPSSSAGDELTKKQRQNQKKRDKEREARDAIADEQRRRLAEFRKEQASEQRWSMPVALPQTQQNGVWNSVSRQQSTTQAQAPTQGAQGQGGQPPSPTPSSPSSPNSHHPRKLHKQPPQQKVEYIPYSPPSLLKSFRPPPPLDVPAVPVTGTAPAGMSTPDDSDSDGWHSVRAPPPRTKPLSTSTATPSTAVPARRRGAFDLLNDEDADAELPQIGDSRYVRPKVPWAD